MKNDEIIENQQQIIDTIVNTVSDIKKIYIFGSYARKNATDESDIDLYIILNNLNTLNEAIKISENIKKALMKKKLYKRMDLLLNDLKDFDQKKNLNGTIENIVNLEGVSIYG